jgi:hypothetical protein
MTIAPEPTVTNCQAASTNPAVASGAGASGSERQYCAWPALFITIALALIFLVAQIGYHVQTVHFANYSYIYDPVSYMYMNAKTFLRLQDSGLINTLFYELQKSGYPWRTVPLLLVAPDLLAAPLGHMATSLPLMGLFAALLGWTSYRRGGSLLYAAATPVVLLAIPGLFDTKFGVGQNWLDFASAWTVGACYLCALNHERTLKRQWLVMAALALTLGAWCRYVSCVYAVLICGPMLAYNWLAGWRTQKLSASAIGKQVLTLVSATLFLAGPFLYTRFADMYVRYTEVGYGLNQTIEAAYIGLSSVLLTALLNVPFLAFIASIALANLLLTQFRGASGLIVNRLWPAVSVPLLLVLVLRAPQNGYVLWHEIPVLIAAVVVPLGTFKYSPKVLPGISAATLVVASSLLSFGNIQHQLERAAHPAPDVAELKFLDRTLADEIIKLPAESTWSPFFAEYHVIPNMVAFYSNHRLVRIPEPGLFTEHKAFWVQDYKTDSPTLISARVLKGVEANCAMVVVYDSPQQIDRAQRLAILGNPISIEVSRQVLKHVAHNSHWQKVSTINNQRFGTLAIYRRKTAR